jgi:hypothetical protein
MIYCMEPTKPTGRKALQFSSSGSLLKGTHGFRKKANDAFS